MIKITIRLEWTHGELKVNNSGNENRIICGQ
jgi:hypothetical protein